MSNTATEKLISEMDRIYKSDPEAGADLIEVYLEKKFAQLSVEKKLALLEKISIAVHEKKEPDINSSMEDHDIFKKIFALFLGEKISNSAIPPDELVQRLSMALNTIFDSLNELVILINTTFFSNRVVDETIRHVIQFQLEGGNPAESLENYIGQIKKAFLISQEAFKQASKTVIGEVLFELSPDNISAEERGGLKFGRLRKADRYKIYQEKYERCYKWFESDRFMKDLLRQFENNCQKSV